VKFIPNGVAVNAPVGVSVNQLTFMQLCSDTEAVALVFDWANTVSICAAGGEPPAGALNV
jgi:hypothetical protein